MTSAGKRPRDREEACIAVCEACGHVQMWPLLSAEEEKTEYDDDVSLRFGKVKIADGSDAAAMRAKFREWTKAHADIYFDALQNFGNVLEIGAGYGFFMEEVSARPGKKFDIEGLEIGRFRLENFAGGTVYAINVLTDGVPAKMRQKYDCVICMHVLEHINRPVLFLEKIKAFLKPGGRVIFEVPNIDCFLGEISAAYKDFMYLYEHCSYFSSGTLRLVFEKAGYRVLEVVTREIYSLENHIRWVREGTPFTKYNQMYMPCAELEFINEIYKAEIGGRGKGFALTIEACPR